MNPPSTPSHRPADTRWLRWGLAAIAFLLTVIALELSVLIGPIQPRAHAQIPDSGAQINQLIEGQKQANRALEQILDHLRTGEVKVTLGSADKGSRATPPTTSAPRRNQPAARPQTAPRTR